MDILDQKYMFDGTECIVNKQFVRLLINKARFCKTTKFMEEYQGFVHHYEYKLRICNDNIFGPALSLNVYKEDKTSHFDLFANTCTAIQVGSCSLLNEFFVSLDNGILLNAETNIPVIR